MNSFLQKLRRHSASRQPAVSRYRRWLHPLASLASFILIAVVAVYIDQLNDHNRELNHRDAVLREMGSISAKVESDLKGDLQAAKAMVAAVRQHPDLNPDYLDKYSESLLSGESRIRSVAVFRGVIGAYVYPLKGNEPVLGLDLRTRPDQLADMMKVHKTGGAVLSGPVELVQGGMALIARLPGGQSQGTGEPMTVSAVIDIEQLLRSSGLSEAGERLQVAIRKYGPEGRLGKTVFGDAALFNDQTRAVTTDIRLPLDERWQIAAAPESGWLQMNLLDPFRVVVASLALIIFCFLTIISWLLAKRYESNQLLVQLFELSPIGIALNDYETGKFIAANQSLCKSLGYPHDQLTEICYQELTPPEYMLDDEAALIILTETGRLDRYEKHLVRADGKTVPIEINSILFSDSRGTPRIWSMIEDISERKHAAQIMDRQQQMFNSMSQQARIGAWELEVESGQLTWSEVTREICGVPANFTPTEEALRRVFPQEEMWHLLQHLIRRAIINGQAFSEEVKLTTQQGRELWIQLTGHPVLDKQRCTHIFGSLQDIDDRKRAAEALIRARDEAEQAARSKSEFLATMSHEIRTPMNGVLGMLNLLANSDLDFEQERRVSIARSSAHSLLSLIDDVLDFSRIDAGKMTLEDSSFAIREVIEEVCESMSLRAQEKGLELIVDLSEINIDKVSGDAARLRQVLTNLLGNALKFTESGEIVVHATLTEHQNQWIFDCYVRDTGIGIASEKLDSLFSAFTQADASTTRRYGGSGLGLSISQKICQAMNGSIAVSSKENKGSTFHVQVMLNSSADASFDEACASGRHVWLIEDNINSCKSLERQLLRWGAKVYCSTSSESALNSAESHDIPLEKIDLVIIDRYMDGLDGTELVQFLRQEEHLSSQPFVLLSKISSQGTDAHFRSLGFDAWYPKPLTTSNLREALKLAPLGSYLQSDSSDRTQEPPASSLLQGRRVLLVEDNAVNQEVVRCLLDELGLQVSIADNGNKAIAALKHQQDKQAPPYSAILMDCQMPEMDGYECTRQIRAGLAGEAARELPIIALTANALSGDREKCSAAGMDDYLSKPIDPDRLHKKLLSWLHASRSDDPANPASKNHTEALWNADKALEGVMGQERTLNKMLLMFNEYSIAQQQALRSAVTAADTAEIARISRALKGSSGQLQGDALRELASSLELAASNKDWEKIHYFYPQLHQCWLQLCACFEQYLLRNTNKSRALIEG